MSNFTPLAQFFKGPAVAAQPAAAQTAEEAADEMPVYHDALRIEIDDALSEVRRFRASLADALDAAMDWLLREVACEVIGGELQLRPCELSDIVRAALERYRECDPLAIEVHADDAPSVRAALPVCVVDDVRRGDARIRLRCGTIDASLGVRLASVLDRYAS